MVCIARYMVYAAATCLSFRPSVMIEYNVKTAKGTDQGENPLAVSLRANCHNNNNRLYSTPDTPQAGVQRHHTGMRGAGVAPVGCQPQSPACMSNTAPVVHLSQPKLVPTLLLGGQGYMWVHYEIPTGLPLTRASNKTVYRHLSIKGRNPLGELVGN